MNNVFFTSDTHFSHENILKFTTKHGAPARPGFSSIEEMDEKLVEKWNSVVKPHDKVYHLGDVTMKKRFIDIVNRLNGRKRLIMGNHDIFGFKFYADYFDEVYAMRIIPQENLMLTHIPIQSQSIKRGFINVHGHIHERIICDDEQMDYPSASNVQHPKYFNACVEQHNYTPVSLDVVSDYVKKMKYDLSE